VAGEASSTSDTLSLAHPVTERLYLVPKLLYGAHAVPIRKLILSSARGATKPDVAFWSVEYSIPAVTLGNVEREFLGQ
jgi:hypothetical protein